MSATSAVPARPSSHSVQTMTNFRPIPISNNPYFKIKEIILKLCVLFVFYLRLLEWYSFKTFPCTFRIASTKQNKTEWHGMGLGTLWYQTIFKNTMCFHKHPIIVTICRIVLFAKLKHQSSSSNATHAANSLF